MADETKYIGLVGILILVVGALFVVSIIDKVPQPQGGAGSELKTFNNYDELKGFLKENSELSNSFYGYGRAMGVDSATALPAATTGAVAEKAGGGAGDYSRTNIQVEGVDEPDIVKNDGKYIYSVNGNKVEIVYAYPPEDMKIVSEINVGSYVNNIFINGDKLIIFSQSYGPIGILESEVAESSGMMPPIRNSGPQTKIYVYNIENREKPVLENNISAEGNYVDARMIGEYVYVISNKQVSIDAPVLPYYEVNGAVREVGIKDVYYFDYPDNNYVFSSIISLNVENGALNSEVYLTGYSSNIYVSQDNIYLTYTKTFDSRDYIEKMIKEVIVRALPLDVKLKVENIVNSEKGSYQKWNEISKIVEEYSKGLKGSEKAEFDKKLLEGMENFQAEMAKEQQKSVIHKINVDGGEIEYKAMGEAPGSILNQFSMDEYKGYFRVATTTGDIWGGNSLNHVYVLDEELEIVGKIEDLAKGEKIYSARFMGERAYMVTFKKIDPLYVIDLKNAENPKVLGYLKIPGYSDYLHPYDENHVIGIGKEAVDAEEDLNSRGIDFAWYQGLKISLFDVTDVENPKEQAKIVIGDRGTDSYALTEHKAFLFDKKRNLLVIPISLAKIDKSQYEGREIPANAYGQIVWQGAFVLNIDLNGISEKGRITHFDSKSKYGAAKEEVVGAVREIYGQTYIKIGENSWKIENDYENNPYSKTTWTDSYIDQMPGGINYHNFYGGNQIQRSLYMNNFLYTISQSKIKANSLLDMGEISSVVIKADIEI